MMDTRTKTYVNVAPFAKGDPRVTIHFLHRGEKAIKNAQPTLLKRSIQLRFVQRVTGGTGQYLLAAFRMLLESTVDRGMP